MIQRSLISSLTILGILMAVGCTARLDHHGKLPDPEVVAQIKPGIHDKDEVLRLIGTPSSVAEFDKNSWIYDYHVTETKAFYEPTEILHRLTLIQFNSNGRVKEIHTEDGKGRDLVPVRRITSTAGDDQTFLQSIFGNFGRKSKQIKNDSKSD